MAFSASPERQNMARKRGIGRAEALAEGAEARRRLDEQLEHARHATCILSAEHVVFLKPPEMAALAECLGRCGEPLHVVGYVRAPVSYMESVFQQHVKGGREAFDAEKTFPRYVQRFSRLEKAFGRARLDYWFFDPRSFPDGCVVRDFCTRLGIDFAPERVLRSNEALSLPAVRLLYAYRRFGPGYGTGQRAIRENLELIRELGTLQGPRLRFHAELVAPLLAERREEIAWMEERLGCSLAEPLREDADALRGEEDLLRFGSAELEWLAERTPGGAVEPEPAAVAARMDVLRRRVAVPSSRATPPAGLFGRLRRLLGKRS
jgi:hypothetical protein